MSNEKEEALDFLLGVFENLNMLSETHFEPIMFSENVNNLLKRERPTSFNKLAKSKGFSIPKLK
ncbi:MAG: hypothetical protein HRU24_18875 [Gammaproteobacteria bacterium]|nr:hypothetical protein [Gammaproteobacteria bacterium]